MEDKLKKYDNETELEYIKRLVYGKLVDKTIDADFIELSPLIFDYQFSSSECRKRMYGMKFLFEKIDKNKLNNIDDNEVLIDIEEKIKELAKEKIRFQDQKREYRNYLRADARFEHLKETMKNEIIKLNEIKPFSIANILTNSNNIHGVLILSDWHIGLKEKNYWNEVDIEIMKKRVEELQNKVIHICERHKINTLHIELLGDCINGLIHVTTRISNEEDTIQQTMICSEILSNMLVNLAKKIPNIKFYSCTGNHGRCVANAKESLDTENFEKLIPWYLQTRLKNINNVEFVENKFDDNIIVYQFLNETIFAVHGHEDKINKSVDELSKMFKLFPSELHMGHFHSYYEKEDHDISVVVNGTLSGVDKFAKHIRKTSKPEQTMLIYNENGRECTYKIKVK